MEAFQVKEKWGLENIHKTELPDPAPGPGEVLLRVKAVSLNFRDHLVVHGLYNPKYPVPLIPCSDGAGVIEAVGDGVQDWQTGDRVMGHSAINWLDGSNDKSTLKNTLGGPLDGTLRELMVLPAQALVRIPEHLDYKQAATLPCAALTAWSALHTYGQLKPGQTVLALGTGGVSIFALQLAKLSGARVIVTSSDDSKLEKAQELGADATINYKTNPDWDREVFDLTNGQGVDNVIEVGGAGTLEKSLRSVRPNGQVSLIGVLAGGNRDLSLLPILMYNIRLQGIFVGHKAGFVALNQLIELHKMEPVIDKVFEFDEAVESLKYLASGQHFGKVVIKIGS